MLTLEQIKKDTIWVAKMNWGRMSGTYEEMKPYREADEEGGLEDAGVSYHCSECGHVGWGSENYCPICGTKMDGKVNV